MDAVFRLGVRAADWKERVLRDAARVESVGEAQPAALDERRAGPLRRPPLVEGQGDRVFGPVDEVVRRKVRVVVSARALLRLVVPPVEQVEHVQTVIVHAGRDVAHPGVVVRRCPVLDGDFHRT